MRRLIAGLVIVVMGLLTLAVPVSGAEHYDLPSLFEEFKGTKEGQDLIRRWSRSPDQAPDGMAVDPAGDFEFSTGEEPGLTPDVPIDILSADVYRLNPPLSFFSPQADGGAFCETDPSSPPIAGVVTVCPDDFDKSAFDGGAIVARFQLAEDFGMFNLSRTSEFVVWGQMNAASPVFENLPAYPNDPAGGTNRAWGLRTSMDQFGPFGLSLNGSGSFSPFDTDAIAAFGEDQLVLFIPAQEWGDTVAANFYTFSTDGSYTAAGSVADQTGLFAAEVLATYSLIESQSGFTGPLGLTVDLMATGTGAAGCSAFAQEYSVELDAWLGDPAGGSAPLRLVQFPSGQVSDGTATVNGEARLATEGSGEGYTESYLFKGQAVEYTYVSDVGECPYAGTVMAGYDELDSFFDIHFVVEDATTTTIATTPSDPVSGGAETPTDDTLLGDPEGEDDAIRTWTPIYLIIGGLVIIVGGYWVYNRTRVRKPPGTPPVYSVPRDPPHTNCDWSVYFNSGGVRTALRTARGHECCVYDLDVTTVNPVFEEAAKGRQDGKNPHGEDASADERLRMFDYDMGSNGPNVKAFASTRTGPAGRQDWMHGLGDPVFEAGWKSTAEGEQHRQVKPLEEPVDAGLSLRYEAKTTVKAKLSAGCPDYENSFTIGGASGVGMFATQECTNGEPGPECPVELTASGIVDASVKGDLAYDLVMKAATYPDELERKSPEWLEGPIGGIDSHDHATRPRSTWEDGDSVSTGVVVKKDDASVVLNSKIHLDSGQIVPIEVWDTTERVSTHIKAELDHTLDLDGAMTTHCTDGCGGHGRCDCDPSFTLQIAAGKGTITVDGDLYDIQRAPFTDAWVLS